MKKKLITLIVILCIFLSLLVYQAHSLSKPHVSDLLIEEHGDLFLLLPISNKKARVYYSSRSELEKTDLYLLRETERKLWDRINSYSERQEPLFTVHAKDGEVRLYVELIVIYDPPHIPDWPTSPDPTAPTPPQSGCRIDHDHLNFYEVISAQPTNPPAEPPTESTKEEIINGNTVGPPLTHETIVP